MTTSFFANRALVQETGIQTARALDTRLPLAEQLVALHTLQGELERLQYRIREGAPWYQRFGLERNQQLLAAAFPGYAQAANRLVRDAVDHLQQQLNAFVALPPNSPQRTATGEQRYKQLKALLMTSRPEKADAAFFSTTLMADGLRYENIPEGVRQSVLPSLLTFWTANLPEHPQWKTSPPPELTGAVRKILLRQIGVRNAENTLYQNVLQQVSRNYADMTLADMTGDTSPNLFQYGTDGAGDVHPSGVGRTGQGSHRAGGDGAARGNRLGTQRPPAGYLCGYLAGYAA